MLTFQKKSTLVTGKKKGGGNLNYADLVYFTFAMFCDVAPGDLTTSIMVEWIRAGGVGLYSKEIQAFNTFLPFVILMMCIDVLAHTLVAEFCKLMEEAMRMLEEEAMVDGVPVVQVIPQFTFRKSLPKLPGLDPDKYSGLTARQSLTRRAWHIKMETQHVATFTRLIEKCKEFTMFEDVWGMHVLILKVVDFDSPPGDISWLHKEAKKHTCFQVSMTCTQLYKILDLDAMVPYKQPEEGEEASSLLSLRQVLSKHFWTRDNRSPLFAEIYQKQHSAAVEVVIPNTKEAKVMVRQLPAFIKHYLLGKGLDQDFVTRLVLAALRESELLTAWLQGIEPCEWKGTQRSGN